MTGDRSRSEERRSGARLRPGGRPLTVQYRFVTSEGRSADPQVYGGQALNVSPGGMLLRGSLPGVDVDRAGNRASRLLVGADLIVFEIVFELEAGEPDLIRGLAEVCWIRPAPGEDRHDLGLRFARLADGDRRRLERRLLRRGRDSGRSPLRPEVL